MAPGGVHGTLNISLTGGANIALSSSEEFLVVARTPDSWKAPKLQTAKAKKEKLDTWNQQITVSFSEPFSPEDKIELILQEYSVFSNKALGQGVFKLAALFGGGARVREKIALGPVGGSPLCEISIDLNWDGDIPTFVSGSAAAVDGAVAANGTSGAGLGVVMPGTARAVGGGAVPLPNCDGRAYSVRVLIRKAKNLQSESDNEVYDPLVTVTVGNETQKTDYQPKTNEPIFDEELMFMIPKADANFWSMPMVVTAMDHRIGRADKEIGMTQIEMQTAYRYKQHVMAHKWFILRKGGMSTQIMGFLKMTIMVLDALNDQIPELEEDPEDGDESEDALILNLVNTPGAQFEEVNLRCEILRAQGLPQMDYLSKKCDPYVVVSYGTKSNKTPHFSENLAPEWNKSLALPIQVPALLDSLVVQLWDKDDVGRDKIISTKRLSVEEMTRGSENGLPHLSAQFINFYGCPRSVYRDLVVSKSKYFDQMDRGVKEGIDFRGRVLCRMVGTRERVGVQENCATRPRTSKVNVVVRLQALQFSMVKKGTYQFQVSCGNGEGKDPASCKVPKKAEEMLGTSDGLAAVYFGEEIRFEHSIEVVIPNPELVALPKAREFIVKQIPDVIVHLMVDKNIYAAYRVKASTLLYHEQGVSICDTMRVVSDPEKLDDGDAPTDPLAQFNVGMYINKVEPGPHCFEAGSQRPLMTSDEINMFGVTTDVRMLGLSDKQSVKYRLECCVFKGVNFPVGDPNGLSDPFVRVTWANGAAQTGAQLETLNPSYDELVIVYADAKQPFTNIVVELWDWDFIGKNTFLARAVVDEEWAGEVKGGTPFWIDNFTDNRGRKVDSKLLVSLEVLRVVENLAAPKKTRFLKKPGGNETYEGFEIWPDSRLEVRPHLISMSLYSLRKMRPFRLLDVKRPQVEAQIGNQVVTFKKCEGKNPDINQTVSVVMELPVNPAYWPNISFSVYDHRHLGSKPRVAVGTLRLNKEGKDQNGNDALLNAFHPKTADETKKEAEKLISERVQAIATWKSEAFLTSGGVAEMNLQQSINFSGTYGSMPSSGDKEKDFQFKKAYQELIAKRDASREAKERTSQKRKKKAREGKEGSNDGDDVEMEDSEKETDMTDADLAMQAVKIAQESQFAEVAQKEIKDNVIPAEEKKVLKPSDIPWFERFDADGTIENTDFIVSRLGKIHDYYTKKSGPFKKASEGTAEAYFGPFQEEGLTIQLTQGFDKRSSKAAELSLNISIDDSEQARPKAVDAKPIAALDLSGRGKIEYQMRVYLVSCRHLAAVDHSIFGSSSDPYVVLSLSSGNEGDSKSDIVKLNLKEQRKEKTLNPDYFLVQQMQGELPKHGNLCIEVWDHNDILADKLIGFTNVNLEQRWYSNRGYSGKRAYMDPGMYTEKRHLRDETGQIKGTIELWIDMFNAKQPIPVPIDITPPPPIEFELRTIVWQTRDVELEDMSLSGEAMSDIYVRCWMEGMRNDMQNTDVHYRSLDGSGTFNWRMNFQFMFDPRSKRIMPIGKKAKSIANWFRIRREQKKYDPIVKLQISDNTLLPGTDNFIGETSLNLMKLHPVASSREKLALLEEMLGDLKKAATTFLCCSCCHKTVTVKDLTLEERQRLAVAEFKNDMMKREQQFREEANERIMQLQAVRTVDPAEVDNLRKRFIAEARAKTTINAFDSFFPKRSKNMGKHLKDSLELPPVAETARYWFSTRGPKGSCRTGDVQVSFQLVRLEAMTKDENLQAGRGRAEPQALPEPNRPDSSFFWLTSPFKAATHILWKRYKWYILAVVAILLTGLFLYVFFSEGIRVKSEHFFE